MCKAFSTNWLIRAVEQKNPKLSVALADSVPLVVAEDKLDLGTREMTTGDYGPNEN